MLLAELTFWSCLALAAWTYAGYPALLAVLASRRCRTLVRARIETKLGLIPEARQSLHRAAELNPRSALFQALLGD